MPPFVNLNSKVAPVFQHDSTYLYLSGNLTFRKLPKRRDHPQVRCRDCRQRHARRISLHA